MIYYKGALQAHYSMNFNQFRGFIRQYWVRIVIFFVIILSAFIVFRVSGAGDNRFVPHSFLEARTNGSMIAELIVQLSDESVKNLQEINNHDKEGNFALASDLVRAELRRNNEARAKALDLSKQLEQMTIGLRAVQPEQAQLLVTQAISYEISLINRLLTYNDYLNQLLSTLQSRFDGTGGSSGMVSQLLQNLNTEAQAINDLNAKYTATMGEFDRIYE